jgi:hypothetical protein
LCGNKKLYKMLVGKYDGKVSLDRSWQRKIFTSIYMNYFIHYGSKGNFGLEVNREKIKYILLSHHQNTGRYHNTKIVNRSLQIVTRFKYVGMAVTKQNVIPEEIKMRTNSVNASYHSVQNLFVFFSVVKNAKIRIYKTIILPVVLYGHETWPLALKRNTE